MGVTWMTATSPVGSLRTGDEGGASVGGSGASTWESGVADSSARAAAVIATQRPSVAPALHRESRMPRLPLSSAKREGTSAALALSSSTAAPSGRYPGFRARLTARANHLRRRF